MKHSKMRVQQYLVPSKGSTGEVSVYAVVLIVRGSESGRYVCRRQQDLRRDERGLEREEDESR